MVWQLVRLYLVKSIDLKHVPEITRLLEEGEELHDLQKLPPEKILIRWLNYHLEKDGTDRRVSNFGKDLADGDVYIRVIHQLDKNSLSKDLLNEDDKVKRGQGIIKGAEKLGVTSAIKPSDIASGNVKLNTLFCSLIFNAKHGLAELEADDYEAAKMLEDDAEGTKEERSYRLWINSLGIEDVNITNLYEECKDGMLLLRVIDKI